MTIFEVIKKIIDSNKNKDEEIKRIRLNYLIEYRNGLWTQIRSKEDSVWRFISFFAAAIVLVGGLMKSDNPSSQTITPHTIFLMTCTILIVSYWGLLITLDANFWMRRNLAIIGNIEREILFKSDFGSLLPISYSEPREFEYTKSYFIQMIFFFITILLCLIAYITTAVFTASSSTNSLLAISQLVSFTFCSLMLYTIHRNRHWISEFGNFRRDAPGVPVENRKPYSLILNEITSYWNSSFEDIIFIITMIGTFGVFFSTMLLQSDIIKYIFLGYFFVYGCISGIVIGLIIRFFHRNKLKKNELSLTSIDENDDLVYSSLKIKHFFDIFQKSLLYICIFMNFIILLIMTISYLPSLFP
jgi:hypothetical protein